MIKYNLKCNHNHEFESWFSDSLEFEKLKKKNLLECIYCSSKKIEKSIMAPMVSNYNEKKIDLKKLEKTLSKEKKKLLEIRKYIETNFEFVGDDLSKKAREIFYDKKSKKTIYGTTTEEEKKELSEEGIEILSVPWIDKEN
tara:strand:- start:50 stop:472 length:423 start_codon:yes stop_codon:yes gene_type:complete